jgi:hypothetical protein
MKLFSSCCQGRRSFRLQVLATVEEKLEILIKALPNSFATYIKEGIPDWIVEIMNCLTVIYCQ